MNEPAEVIVVGSGAGGGLAAWALAQRGVRVLLLEAGPRFDQAAFETHSHDWEITKSPIERVATDPDRQGYESDPGEELDPAYARLTSRGIETVRTLTRRRAFTQTRAIGVGGSTLHYQGEAHRFPAHSFRMASERGVAADWPFPYEELAPHYERVERLLGVAGDPSNPFKPARGAYPYRAHPLSRASKRLAAGASRLGWSLLPNPLGILPEPRRGRRACHYCNGCIRGCMVGAKSSVDVAVLPEAERTGRLQIVTGFQVAYLEHDAAGRIEAVVGYNEEGSEQRHHARAFVLAGGAIETPRLLLNSAGGAHPEGVGNAEGQVGRYFMETLYVMRNGFFEEPLETWVGVPIDARIWDWNGSRGPAQPPNGFALGQFAGSFEGPVGYATRAIPGFGHAHRAEMRRRFGAGLSLMGIAEQMPRATNRVTRSEETDRFGVPLARVETRLDGDDLEVLSRMHERLGELAEASSFGDFVSQWTAYDVSWASHVAGTCRLGVDPKRSVTDAFGRVHGVSNLVVADSSLLVTQGAGDSPSLTIQALAVRNTEHLVERARDGRI